MHVVAAAIVGAAVLCVAPPAAATEEVPGDWYFTAAGVQESLDAGNDGAGVHVAVLDSDINPDVPTLQGVDLTVAPSVCYDAAGVLLPAATDAIDASHGTNSTSLVAGTGAGYPGQVGVRGAAPGAQVTHYSRGAEHVDCYDASGELMDALEERFEQALDDGADIISIQIGSTYIDPSLVARAMRDGVIVLQGLENHFIYENEDHTPELAAMNGVVGVQAIDAFGDPQNGAGSIDKSVDVAAPGVGMTAQGGQSATDTWETQTIQSGTSNAAPFTAGVLAAVWSKYPEATGNQIIQSMIRNTGLEDHELARDDTLGYGILSLRHMLEVDPTQYDDVNPLIVDDRDLTDPASFIEPRYVEIFPDTATPAPSDEPAADTGTDAWLPALIIGGVVVLLILIGVIVLIAVLVTRKKN